MEPEQTNLPERFPATHTADVFFGVVSGAVIGVVMATVTARLLELPIGSMVVAVVAAFLGASVGSIAGSIHHSIRKTFDSSELGIPLGVIYGIIPSLIVFGNASNEAEVGTVKLAVGVSFVGVMGGMILGAVLDRVYETLLKRSIRNRRS